MRRSESSPYPVAAQTHPGMTGKNNEDHYGVSAFLLEDKNNTPSLLAVLADGIGGHRAGEVAAEIAVETLSRVVAESDGDQPRPVLQAAVLEASQEILAASQGQEERRGMGATCACIWLIGHRIYTVTVGDSRIYLMHNGHIRQLSTDHTWVQEALDYGLLQPEEVKNHPNAHVIRRYLGSVKPVVPDFRLRLEDGEKDESAQQNQGMGLYVGDRLLVCSDGLSDLVEPEEIAAAFVDKTQEEAVQSLLDLANQRGGHDNITVIAVEIPAAVVPKKRRGRWLIRLLMLLVILAGLTWLWFWGKNQVVTPIQLPTTSPTTTLQQDLLRTPPPELQPSPTLQDAGTLPTAQSTPRNSSRTPVPLLETSGPDFTYTPWPTNTKAP